jgi:general stress protein 26
MDNDRAEQQIHLVELLQTFSTAMLVTRTAEGTMRARPLTLSDEHDQGRLYFATSIDSPKVAELEKHQDVLITLQDSRRYVSVTGTATVTRDPALVNRLWRETWKIWFPAGKEDPKLCLLVVTPQEAEYWDQSGLDGIGHWLEMAKAYVKGTTPESGVSSDTAKIRFP